MHLTLAAQNVWSSDKILSEIVERDHLLDNLGRKEPMHDDSPQGVVGILSLMPIQLTPPSF